MEEYAIESVVRGHHVHKNVWHQVLEEQLTLERENVQQYSHDRHAVSEMKNGTIVGCVPQELSSAYYQNF